MIEAAKVIVPIGRGKEVEARAIAAGLQALTEPYHEDGVDEVIVEAEDEANLFEESGLSPTCLFDPALGQDFVLRYPPQLDRADGGTE